MFLLFTARHKVSQQQRWGGNERSDRSLSGHFHKAESWSIRSTFQNCLGLRPTWLVFSKAPGLGFNWEAAHVQLGISCLFFWNRLSSFLSFSSISVIPLLSNPPPPQPPPQPPFPPPPRYLAVITDYVMQIRYSATVHLTTAGRSLLGAKSDLCLKGSHVDRFASLDIMVWSTPVTVMT